MVEDWWSGVGVTHGPLLGLPALMWGRAGTVLQYAGGVVVVLDVVGSARLRAYGERSAALHEARLAVLRVARDGEPELPGRAWKLAGMVAPIVPLWVAAVATVLVEGRPDLWLGAAVSFSVPLLILGRVFGARISAALEVAMAEVVFLPGRFAAGSAVILSRAGHPLRVLAVLLLAAGTVMTFVV